MFYDACFLLERTKSQIIFSNVSVGDIRCLPTHHQITCTYISIYNRGLGGVIEARTCRNIVCEIGQTTTTDLSWKWTQRNYHTIIINYSRLWEKNTHTHRNLYETIWFILSLAQHGHSCPMIVLFVLFILSILTTSNGTIILYYYILSWGARAITPAIWWWHECYHLIVKLLRHSNRIYSSAWKWAKIGP